VRQRLGVLLWVAIIVAAVLPWTSWQDHPHWSKIGWWPFISPPVRLRDIVINFALYVPLGYLLARGTGHSRLTWLRVLGVALVLSVSTEATQIYSHSRFPSATDAAVNVIGAAIGARYRMLRSKAAISRRFLTSSRPRSSAG
jgi:glycopeptide antibiotics resistance protein